MVPTILNLLLNRNFEGKLSFLFPLYQVILPTPVLKFCKMDSSRSFFPPAPLHSLVNEVSHAPRKIFWEIADINEEMDLLGGFSQQDEQRK